MWLPWTLTMTPCTSRPSRPGEAAAPTGTLSSNRPGTPGLFPSEIVIYEYENYHFFLSGANWTRGDQLQRRPGLSSRQQKLGDMPVAGSWWLVAVIVTSVYICTRVGWGEITICVSPLVLLSCPRYLLSSHYHFVDNKGDPKIVRDDSWVTPIYLHQHFRGAEKLTNLIV